MSAIMIVEDEESLLKLIVDCLRIFGFKGNIYCAKSIAEVKNVLSKSIEDGEELNLFFLDDYLPDGLLSDTEMPAFIDKHFPKSVKATICGNPFTPLQSRDYIRIGKPMNFGTFLNVIRCNN